MNKTVYDIFISYRRDGGGATAGRINDMLTSDGYSVSYDVDTLREGRFDDQLLTRIEQCQDFIIVVDKNCFVRTVDPATDPKEDWLWQELSYALKLRKNVIPVLLAGADFPKHLPEDIDSVRFYNGPKCVHEYFDSFYEKLKDQLRAFPRLARPQADVAGTSTVKLPHLKLKADMDCVFCLDGEERTHLKAGVLQKLPVAPGEYELLFVSEENDADRVEMDFEMPDVDKLLKVSMSTAKDSRLQKEAEARRQAEEERQAEERRLAEEKQKAEELRQAELRRQEAERRAAEERKREEERRRREAEEQKRREEEERKRKEEEARAAVREFAVGGVPFKMIRVEGGSFMMGSLENDSDAFDDEKPQHRVTLSDYYIGETPVTQALWKAVTGSNPSNWKGDNLPVECVSWHDCQKFIEKLNQKTGRKFRLPTEAEWEFAARGGTKSKGYKYSGSNNLDEVAWYTVNSGSKTHPVKFKKANELGVYDMSGNVWEWCQDKYGSYSSDSQTDPTGPASGSDCVLRGGSWNAYARYCRVAYRAYGSPDYRNNFGFRLSLAHDTVSDDHVMNRKANSHFVR